MKRRLVIVLLVLAIVILNSCSENSKWHASEHMVGDWEILRIETLSGELVWETDKWDEYAFYFSAILIDQNGSFELIITTDEDNIIIDDGVWESEEAEGLSQIRVDLNDGSSFEIAWDGTNTLETIWYQDSEYKYVFTKMDDSQREELEEPKNTDQTVRDTFDNNGNCYDANGNWVDPEDDMKYQYVESSALDQVGYSERTQTMDIQFDNTGWYRYTKIESALYNQFINADSLGTFYNDYIKGQYPCTDLE